MFIFGVSSRDMNVERLHRVAQLVWNELESTDAPGLIARLRSGLETFSASPSDVQSQQTISEARLAKHEQALHILSAAVGAAVAALALLLFSSP